MVNTGKKVGERVILGTVGQNATKRIPISRAPNFKTAFKIKEFQIVSNDPAFDNFEHTAIIFTVEPSSFERIFDFSSNTQIAWGYSEDTLAPGSWFIDDDAAFVEDIFISAYSTGDIDWINFRILLEEYAIDEWSAAYTMTRSRSQA